MPQIQNLFSSLHSEIEGTLRLAGDTNLALDHTLDKSSSIVYKHPSKFLTYYFVMILLMRGEKPIQNERLFFLFNRTSTTF